MQPATERTVLGSFDGAAFEHFGETSLFFKKGQKFYVATTGPNGEKTDFEIKYTFGVEPLQQYLIASENGKLQALTIAWDTQKNQWFHLYPNEKIHHNDPLHWTGPYLNWNSNCADCHSTTLRKNYNLLDDSYKTAWEIINVDCQACHGPGKAHVEWAQKADASADNRKYSLKELKLPDVFSTAHEQVESCAPCHSRRQRIHAETTFGEPLLNAYLPTLLRENLYYADGQIQDEVYVYGSFVQSKMHRAGVKCSDCHNPHSLKLKFEGNLLCVQCHQQKTRQDFPSLTAKNYDTPEHHFHAEGSEGAQCVNCHMPERTYMVVDPRRDHSFRIPRPDLSLKIDSPNACTMCHTDKTDQWAVQTVEKWYGEKERPMHFGEALAAGREGSAEAVPKLAALIEDSSYPAIARATALEQLRGFPQIEMETISSALSDADPLVRFAAIGSLDRLHVAERKSAVALMLADSIRAVRIEAARMLTDVPPDFFEKGEFAKQKSALQEYKITQYFSADQPSGLLNLGVFFEQESKADSAVFVYRRALEKDRDFYPAYQNLAQLYNRLRRNVEALEVLNQGLGRFPDDGELHYSAGLILAEEKQLVTATEHLQRAVELLPSRPRIWYNCGLAMQQIGKLDEAERALLKAYELQKDNPDFLYAIMAFYMQQERWQEALLFAEKLHEISPDKNATQNFLDQIRKHL